MLACERLKLGPRWFMKPFSVSVLPVPYGWAAVSPLLHCDPSLHCESITVVATVACSRPLCLLNTKPKGSPPIIGI